MPVRPAAGEGNPRHPWQLARSEFFERLLRERRGATERWLDVGLGDGWLATRLGSRLFPGARTECWDAYYSDEYLAKQTWADGVKVIATREPSDGPFDLVTAFDVLKHVADDRAMLRRIHRVMREDANLAISVPAWPVLYGRHDRGLLHHRRYRPARMQRLLREAGFRILSHGGLFHTPLPLRALERLLETLGVMDGERAPGLSWRAPGWVTRVVDRALALDTLLSDEAASRWLMVPGLSYWALCARA